MTGQRYKIVFDGRLLPGVELQTAKENLASLFKTGIDAVEKLFSGRPVALKRDLSEIEAQRYLGALNTAGLDAHVESDAMASLSLVDDGDNRPHEALKANHLMTCPKCGHEQEKSTECTACGIIIEKYLAAQAQQQEFMASQVSSPRAASPYAPPRAQVGESFSEFGELTVWGITGRIGRVRYLAWSLVLALVSIPILGVLQSLLKVSMVLGVVLLLVAYIAEITLSVMIGAKRVHDLDWSAWWLLLFLVPLANLIFGVMIMFMPGSQDANRFGAPPPPNSTAVKVLAWGWLALLALAIVVGAIAGFMYSGYVRQAHAQPVSINQAATGSPAIAATTVQFDPTYLVATNDKKKSTTKGDDSDDDDDDDDTQ